MIYKYLLPDTRTQLTATIQLPAGARILSIGVQRNQPMLWAQVDPEAPLRRRKLFYCDTGDQEPEHRDATFLGTLLLDDGDFVSHVFVLGQEF